MNAWKLVYSIIVTIIALVGSAASILGWLSLAEENREGVLNFLATWQIGLLICLLIVAVFFGSWLFIRTVDIRNTP